MTTANTPWHTASWFTSPWNHDEAVASDLAFPAGIEIHDVTLRDGEQQAGVIFTADEKVRIAEALAEAGVHRIEAGLPAVSPADFEAVRRIAAMGLPSKIYAFSRCTVEDVERAIDCGVHGVVMEIPSSRHLIELGYRWSVERAIELSVAATRKAHEAGLAVSFFPIDATRASLEDYLNLVEAVAKDGHLDGLGLVDTFGVLVPHAVERFVRASQERFSVPL
jgi:isopropylmalate/homocitrate/citramalate synthase